MDSRTRITRTLLLMMVLTLSGCASWFGSGSKVLEQRFKLHFRVDNPNDSTLTVRGIRYAVYLGPIKLSEGEYSHWFSVKPNSHAQFVVPIRTNLWPHVRSLVKLLETPEQAIPYRLEGTLETGLFFGYDVHVMRKGEIIAADFIPE